MNESWGCVRVKRPRMPGNNKPKTIKMDNNLWNIFLFPQ